MAREYIVTGYLNTGYRPGTIGQTEFDRPKSRAIFESLYPVDDKDVLPLTDKDSRFLMRSIYQKTSIKVKNTPTQKDLIYAVDYLKIEAVQGGKDREVAYYFVNTPLTQYIGADTAILSIEIDELTTADAFNTASFTGVLERRIMGASEPLNFLPEEYTPAYPMRTTVSYCTLESGAGVTRTGGIAQRTGSLTLVPVYASLRNVGTEENPQVNPLPGGGNYVYVTVGSGANIFGFQLDNVAFVDPKNAEVQKGLTFLRKTGNSSLIGSAFTIPLQILDGDPTTYSDGGIPMIIGLKTNTFLFAPSMTTIDDDYNIYNQIKHKKAAYLWTTYTITAAGSGDSATFNLDEIIESTTAGITPTESSLNTSKIQISCVGIPLPSGSVYFRPYQLKYIDAATGYDSRISFVSSVRGSEWYSDGLTVVGVDGSYIINRQTSLAQKEHDIATQQVDKQLELTINNIARERLASTVSFGTSLAGAATGNFGAALKGVTEAMNRLGLGISEDKSKGFLGVYKTTSDGGDVFTQREDIAKAQANLTHKQNQLGIDEVLWNAQYARRTQSFAVQPPSGMDVTRIMGSTCGINRTSLSVADIARFDLYLEWFGATVEETYSNKKLKDLPYIDAGDTFSYLKLGVCIFHLPLDTTNWANSSAWRAKIQGEMQTGGRFWHKKMIDYAWKVPVPSDKGYIAVPGGVAPHPDPPTPPDPVPEPEIGDIIKDVIDHDGLASTMTGMTIAASCEVTKDHHFLVWRTGNSGNIIISEVFESKHYLHKLISGGVITGRSIGLFYYEGALYIGHRNPGTTQMGQIMSVDSLTLVNPPNYDYDFAYPQATYGNFGLGFGVDGLGNPKNCIFTPSVCNARTVNQVRVGSQNVTLTPCRLRRTTESSKIGAFGCQVEPPWYGYIVNLLFYPAVADGNSHGVGISPTPFSNYSTTYGYTTESGITVIENNIVNYLTGETLYIGGYTAGAVFDNGMFVQKDGAVMWVDDATGDIETIDPAKIVSQMTTNTYLHKYAPLTGGQLTRLSK